MNKAYIKWARNISVSGTCDRRKVGAVVVKDNKMVGVGVNTSIEGTKTCDEVGHFMINGSCKRTIHAEMNAIHDALSVTQDLKGADLYCNHKPCIDCIKIIALMGIMNVYYEEEYPSEYSELNLPVNLVKVEGELV